MPLWRSLKKIQVVLAIACSVAALTGTVLGSIRYVQRIHSAHLLPESAPTRPLTLVIRDDSTGKPVSRAKVSLDVDAAIPLTKQSDSEGVVSVALPSKAKEAHVTVAAPGYITYDRQLPLWTAGFEDIRLAPQEKRTKAKSQQEPVSSRKEADKPVTIVSAPGGIAIGGGTVSNPQVNNIYGQPAPPPGGGWTQKRIETFREQVQSQSGPSRTVLHPGAEATLKLIGPFIHPILTIFCSVPCKSGGLRIENVANYSLESQLSGTGSSVTELIKQPTYFPSGTTLKYTVYSLDESNVDITDVALGTYP